MINAYDGEIRRTDDLVAKLRAQLVARGLDRSTWMILTSDHGEGFYEHGVAEHGRVFYDEVIRIPLILVPPVGVRGLRSEVDTAVSNLDLFPTVLEILGVDAPEGTPGRSLSRFYDAAAPATSTPLFSESPHGMDLNARAIIWNGYKYIHSPGLSSREHQLFDLKHDPDERNDLTQARPVRVQELRELALAHQEHVLEQRMRLGEHSVELDQDAVERLKSLGYLQ